MGVIRAVSSDQWIRKRRGESKNSDVFIYRKLGSKFSTVIVFFENRMNTLSPTTEIDDKKVRNT